MLMWKCDVCGEICESPTSLSQFRLMPPSWRWRTGSTKNRHEVEIHVCSDACAARYDMVEAEEVGYGWHKPLTTDKVPAIRPLKVPG